MSPALYGFEHLELRTWNPTMMATVNTTLDDIAHVIGFSAAVRISAYYGGRDLYVPTEVSELHPIAKLIGVSRTRAMVNEWPGDRISIPTLSFVSQEERHAKVLYRTLRGFSASEISQELNISKRRVHQIQRGFCDSGILHEFEESKK